MSREASDRRCKTVLQFDIPQHVSRLRTATVSPHDEGANKMSRKRERSQNERDEGFRQRIKDNQNNQTPRGYAQNDETEKMFALVSLSGSCMCFRVLKLLE